MSTVGLVVNPTAAAGRASGAGARTHVLLVRRGHDVHDLSGATHARAAQEARDALPGLDALVVVGGDGMVHLGVDVVAGTGVPLGVVAVGTGNDVARALRLPRRDVDAAVAVVDRALRTGPRRVDAVRATGPDDDDAGAHWFAGVLSCGLDAAVNARANALTWPRGHARYLAALVPELARFRPYGYRVRVDEQEWTSAGTLVAVANTPWFGGGLAIAPHADPHDGLLDVVLAGPLSRAAALGVFPRVYAGRHVTDPRVTVLRGRRVQVAAAPHLGPPPPVAYADGERLRGLPVVAEVVPGALHVLA